MDRRKKRLVREKNSGPKVSTFVPQPLVQPLVPKVSFVLLSQLIQWVKDRNLAKV